MYLRITRARFDPARYDAILPLIRELIAAVQRLPGCQAVYPGMDRTQGTTAFVSVWDSEEHARFSRDVLGDVVKRLEAAGAPAEPPEVLEIVR
jgi:quinol monooxygenase YgiN